MSYYSSGSHSFPPPPSLTTTPNNGTKRRRLMREGHFYQEQEATEYAYPYPPPEYLPPRMDPRDRMMSNPHQWTTPSSMPPATVHLPGTMQMEQNRPREIQWLALLYSRPSIENKVEMDLWVEKVLNLSEPCSDANESGSSSPHLPSGVNMNSSKEKASSRSPTKPNNVTARAAPSNRIDQTNDKDPSPHFPSGVNMNPFKENASSRSPRKPSINVMAHAAPTVRHYACRARGVPNHTVARNAYVVVPSSVQHGDILVCSHPVCASSGRKFRWCTVCQIPVTKRNFSRRHDHGLLTGYYTPQEEDPTEQDEGQSDDDTRDTGTRRGDNDGHHDSADALALLKISKWRADRETKTAHASVPKKL